MESFAVGFSRHIPVGGIQVGQILTKDAEAVHHDQIGDPEIQQVATDGAPRGARAVDDHADP